VELREKRKVLKELLRRELKNLIERRELMALLLEPNQLVLLLQNHRELQRREVKAALNRAQGLEREKVARVLELLRRAEETKVVKEKRVENKHFVIVMTNKLR